SKKPSTPPPISCLPPELLIRIFFTFQSLHDAGNFYQWTSILQISQSWRDLVLGTSSLWGGIMQVYSSRPLHWAVVSLGRSGSAELDITIFAPDPTDSLCDFIFEVLSQMHRIRSYSLMINSFDAQKQLRLLHSLESPAPCLEEVRLDGRGSDEDLFWARETYARSLIPIFSGRAPRLRRMQLHSFPLSLKGFSCDTLVHLILGSVEFPAHLTHLDDVLRILRTSPKIESLDFGPSPFAISSPSGPITPIFLPRLQNLGLRLPAEATATLLSHLSLPSTAHVCLYRKFLLEFQIIQIQTILPDILHAFGRALPPISRFSVAREEYLPFTRFDFWELGSTCQEPRVSLKLFCAGGVGWFLPRPPSFFSHLSEIQIGWGFVSAFVECFKQEPNSFPALKILFLHVSYPANEVPDDVFNSLSCALELRMQGPHGILN
ncbi:hypothetical protein BDN72DRAFT_848315, partial [Pluteus cervinus]